MLEALAKIEELDRQTRAQLPEAEVVDTEVVGNQLPWIS